MPEHLLEEVKSFLPALEGIQDELSNLFDAKLAATRRAQADELLRLSEFESTLVERLKARLEHRRRILKQAGERGLPDDSIRSLVTRIDGADESGLRARLEAARTRSDRLRQESWIQWIAAQRALNHHAELIELIAHSGKKAPIYSAQPGADGTGGALLDASI